MIYIGALEVFRMRLVKFDKNIALRQLCAILVNRNYSECVLFAVPGQHAEASTTATTATATIGIIPTI